MIKAKEGLSERARLLLRDDVFRLECGCQRESFTAACELVARGLFVCHERGSDEQQDTYLDCEITDKGRAWREDAP